MPLRLIHLVNHNIIDDYGGNRWSPCSHHAQFNISSNQNCRVVATLHNPTHSLGWLLSTHVKSPINSHYTSQRLGELYQVSTSTLWGFSKRFSDQIHHNFIPLRSQWRSKLISGDVATLVVGTAYSEDSGMFECVATNSEGSARSSCNLLVTGNSDCVFQVYNKIRRLKVEI